MDLIFIALAVVAGLCFAVQSPVNAALGRRTNAVFAAAVSFTGGALLLFLILLFTGNRLYLLRNAAPYQLLGGVCGMIGVICSIYALPVIQAALTSSLMITGQLVMAVLIDAFGWLGVVPKTIRVTRLAGIAIIFIGIAFVYWGSKKENSKNGTRSRVPLGVCAIVFAAGFFGAVQSPINASLANLVGSVEATFVSFLTGSLVAIVLALITRSFVSLKGRSVRPWTLCGGSFGVVAIFINMIAVQQLGSAIQISSVLIGQLGGSILIDSLGILNVQRIKINRKRIIGMVLLIAGVLCL